ncbi:leukocyte surface antigen CD53-like [Portunus trituberculatus]|uniref:leukocyte surface antigen CD53-like n=1 Tax=Portunus trituberculatus TaxID=210409 RepID=UPI001E1CB6A2|nr:leukocyte surface antigen CD53-like [Portunus trituberculatus]
MGCFTKLALFIVNFAIFAAGVAVVALASMIINTDSTYGSLLINGIFTLPIIILIAGLIIVIIGFLGCCGAMKGSSCMLKTYAFIIIVLLIAEITLGILLLIYPNKAEDAIKTGMHEVFKNYGIDEATEKSIDAIESDLKCCGVDSYQDWQNYSYGSTGNVSRGCCIEDDSDACFMNKNDLPEAQAKQYIYTRGCYAALKEDLKDETIGLGVVLFIMAIVQVLAVTCACGVAKKSSGSTHYA